MVDATTMDNPLANRRARGFSIIEIVIVLTIVGLLAAVAIPRYANSVTRYRADAAARRIVADLELARSAASQASASRQVAFNSGNHTYQLQNVKNLNDNAANYDVDLTDPPYDAQIDAVDFGGDAVLVFDGYGTPDSGGFVQIEVGTEVRRVDVDATSGRATIQ